MLAKTSARLAADFKAQLHRQPGMERLYPSLLVAIIALLYPGQISIFAALTIGEQRREQVVMRAGLVGEKAALRAYQRVLQALSESRSKLPCAYLTASD